MRKVLAMTGNEVMAYAMKQINPDVVAAYPITPATEIVQIFSQYVADGEVDTEFVAVESEHSAMSATIGASAAGARAMTATSSQGLALMWEMLYIASALRLPIVMPEVNRSLSAPINIHADHSDTMGARDSGWIQIYSENSQEAYDGLIQAVRIAEECLLPVMVTIDGFIISHAMERIETFNNKEVQDFIGTYKPAHPLLDTNHPITIGAIDFTDYYFEHKRSQIEAMNNVEPIILKVAQEFKQKFGRSYGLFEEYMMEDAETAIVVLGSTAGTTKVAVNNLRKQGKKVGLLKPRVFRPFPAEKLSKALSNLKAIAVLDRSSGMNAYGGPVFTEISSCLYTSGENPKILNYIYGLGGRDTFVEDIETVYTDLEKVVKTRRVEKLINYLGVRE
ncbi:MAG: pyruvate ferredoxin oxidoreductase [Thermodesulfobacteriota bacterium]